LKRDGRKELIMFHVFQITLAECNKMKIKSEFLPDLRNVFSHTFGILHKENSIFIPEKLILGKKRCITIYYP